jgi:hypothetical protein
VNSPKLFETFYSVVYRETGNVPGGGIAYLAPTAGADRGRRNAQPDSHRPRNQPQGSRTVATDHDSRYRMLFSHPLFVQRLLESYVEEPFTAGLDYSTLERVNASLVSEEFARRESDIIWKVTVAGRRCTCLSSSSFSPPSTVTCRSGFCAISRSSTRASNRARATRRDNR